MKYFLILTFYLLFNTPIVLGASIIGGILHLDSESFSELTVEPFSKESQNQKFIIDNTSNIRLLSGNLIINQNANLLPYRNILQEINKGLAYEEFTIQHQIDNNGLEQLIVIREIINNSSRILELSSINYTFSWMITYEEE